MLCYVLILQGSLQQQSSQHGSQIKMLRAENLSADLLRKRRHSDADAEEREDEVAMIRPMTSVAASRKFVEERGLQLSDDDGEQSDGTDYDEHDIYAVKKTEDYKAVKGQPGMFYKVSLIAAKCLL